MKMANDRRILQALSPQRSQTLADFLAKQPKPTGVSLGAGLADVGSNLINAYMKRQSLEKEQAAEDERASKLAQIFGLGGGGLVAEPTGQSETDFSGVPQRQGMGDGSLQSIGAQLIASRDPELQQLGMQQRLQEMQFEKEQSAKLAAEERKAAQPTEAIRTLRAFQAYPELAEIERQRRAAGATQVNVGAGQTAFEKEGGKIRAEQLMELRKEAGQAIQSLTATDEARKLLDSGIITGTGANFRTEFGKALKTLGFDTGDDVANTEAFMASRAQEVGRIIQLFGAGTGLSDADREFARQAAAGNITMTEDSIRRILDINERASQNIIKEFNTELGSIPDQLKQSLFLNPIEVPTFGKKEEAPSMGGQEFTTPSGITFKVVQ